MFILLFRSDFFENCGCIALFCKLCCTLVCLLALSNAKERCSKKVKHDQPTFQCTSVDVISYKQRTQRQQQHLTTINDLHFYFRSLPHSLSITVCVFVKHFFPPQITDGGTNFSDHSLIPWKSHLEWFILYSMVI